MSQRPLIQRILIPVVVISTLLLAVFGYSVTRNRSEAVETALASKAEAMANFLAKTSAAYLANFDLTALGQFAHVATEDADFRSVIFYDKNKKPANDSAAADQPGDRLIEKQIMDMDGKVLGTLKLSYKTDRIQNAGRSTMFLVIFGILFVESCLVLCILLVVRRVIKSLGIVSNDLTTNSGSLRETSAVLSSTSEFLAGAFRQQASAIQETVSTLDEINATAEVSRQEAIRSAEAAQNSEARAIEVKKSVVELIQAINEISSSNDVIMKEIGEGNQQIAKILDIIREIDNKTKVINDIVFQTKLLSFNASVEAARAGEHGKGFAVVAEEVGNLAQMSGAAAREISAMLASSMEKVETAVRGMENKVGTLVSLGKSKVETGSKVAYQCSESLEKIVEQVTDLSRMVLNISKAFEEQARGVQGITSAMEHLETATSKSTIKVEETVGISEKLLSQSEELGGIVHSLNRDLRGSTVAEVTHSYSRSDGGTGGAGNVHPIAPPRPARGKFAA